MSVPRRVPVKGKPGLWVRLERWGGLHFVEAGFEDASGRVRWQGTGGAARLWSSLADAEAELAERAGGSPR